MARFNFRTGICIVSPHAEDARAPDSIQEAWYVEKVYRPPQRWTFDIVAIAALEQPQADPESSTGAKMFVASRSA